MEEDKAKEKIEQSERLVEGKIKSFLLAPANFTQTERSSKNLTALLKVLGIGLTAKIYFIFNAIGSPFLKNALPTVLTNLVSNIGFQKIIENKDIK